MSRESWLQAGELGLLGCNTSAKVILLLLFNLLMGWFYLNSDTGAVWRHRVGHSLLGGVVGGAGI